MTINEPSIDITCPTCQNCAQFHEPFIFTTQADENEKRPQHRWADWTVIEKYPSILPWGHPDTADKKEHATQYWAIRTSPKVGGATGRRILKYRGDNTTGYTLLHTGIVQCTNCHNTRVHTITWPDEAW